MSPLPTLNDATCSEWRCDLAALEAPWRQLATQTHLPSPFHTWEWFVCWQRHFLPPDPSVLRLFLVHDEAQKLIGIVPFYLRNRIRGWGLPCPSREWRLVGNTDPDYESLTEEPVFLARAGEERRVRDAVLRYLCKEKRGEWDYIKIGLDDGASDGAAPELPLPPFLRLKAHKRLGPALRTLPSSWEMLRKQVSRSMRDNLAYYPRLLERHGHTFTLRFRRTPDDVAAGIDTVIRLHQHRAQSEQFHTKHVSHIPEERHRAFLLDCLPQLASHSKAFLLELVVDGQPVAAQIFLEFGGTLVFYYSGFEIAWQAYSPLLIIARAALEDAIARGVPRANFLRAPAQWKARWGADPVENQQQIRLYRTTPLALMRSAATLALRQKNWLKRQK